MRKWISLMCAAGIAAAALMGCSGAETAGKNETKAAAEAAAGESAESLSSEETKKEKDKKELTKIVVSEFRGICWASAYAAEQLGYFEEEGLDVEFMLYKDGPIAFQGMHAGDSDFCLLSAEPVMTAYDEGMESYLLLTNTNRRTYAFAGAADIKTAADLKGKTIFAGMPGSAPYSFVLSMLKSAGLSENDVNFINLDYGSAIVALGEKQVDGIFFDVYNKAILEETVPDANILLDCTDTQTHEALYGSQFCQTSIVTCTKKFAEENPETVQAFVNASSRALKWISEHTSKELAELISPMYDSMTVDELTAKFECIKDTFSETGEIIPEGYETMESFCLDQGLIENSIPYEDIVASDFMDAAIEK